MDVTEAPPIFHGSPYDYQRSSPQFSWTSLWLSAKFLPDLMGLHMIISEVLPQISWTSLWLSAKFLPDFTGLLMAIRKEPLRFRGFRLIISEVPPRFQGPPYDYQRNSSQISWTSSWLSAKFPPRFHGPPYDYQRISSQISGASLWLSAKFLLDFRGILMIISKVLLLLAMFVPDLVTGIHNTAFYHKNEILPQTIHNRR